MGIPGALALELACGASGGGTWCRERGRPGPAAVGGLVHTARVDPEWFGARPQGLTPLGPQTTRTSLGLSSNTVTGRSPLAEAESSRPHSVFAVVLMLCVPGRPT